jgi:imidazolonepropionase-like amidohydrolase
MKLFLFSVLTASLASVAPAQVPVDAPPRAGLLIRDVTVLDTNSARPVREHQDIRIVGNRIDAINPTGTGAVRGDSVIDGRGLFAIPGLIDAHVHITGGATERHIEALRNALRGGVTGVFDLAGDARGLKALQADQKAGKIVAPSIAYSALFGGGKFFADPRVLEASKGFAAGTAPYMRAIDSKTDLLPVVKAAKATGAMAIKLYAAIDSLAAAKAVTAAHDEGMFVVAHAATFPARPHDLVLAGVDMMTHSPYLVWEGVDRTEDFAARARGDFRKTPPESKSIDSLLNLMVLRRTSLNPTLLVFESQPDSIGRTKWSNEVTRLANKKGVRIVAGTDGMFDSRRDSLPALHRELELLVTGAGLSPYEALRAATVNGAWAMGDTLSGRLLAGRTADLVLLGANPLDDIRNTRAVRLVMQGGKVVKRK